MIHYVTAAEEYHRHEWQAERRKAALPAKLATPADIAPMLRGAVAVPRGEGRFDRMISDFRTSDTMRRFPRSRRDLARLCRDAACRTPDLSIRIKTGPMVLPAPDADRSGRLCQGMSSERVAACSPDYTGYFEQQRRARRRQAHHARSDAAADAGAGARHVRPWPHAEGREDRVRCRRDVDRGGERRRSRRQVSSRCRRPTCSSSNTGRWSRRSSPPTSRSR